MCSPSRSIARRSRLVGFFRSNVDWKRALSFAGATAKKSGGDDRQHRQQPEILQSEEQQRRGRARADRGAAREGHDDRDRERRHDGGGPDAIVLAAEEDARQGHAEHEHQQPRVRHVVPERALRALAQVVVVQDRVLKNAERRAGRGKRQNHRRHRHRTVAGREAVHERDDQQQHELLAFEQAHTRIRRERRRTRASRRRRQTRGQKNDGTAKRSCLVTSSASQHTTATVRRICAMAIEKRTAAPTPNSASRPTCSSRSAGGSWAIALGHGSSHFTLRRCERTLGRVDDLFRADPREAAKVARRADALIARPARQVVDFDRLGDADPARATAPTAPAASARTARRSARASSPRCAAARCRRRCRAPRDRAALAARRARNRRTTGRGRDPPVRAARAPASITRPAA